MIQGKEYAKCWLIDQIFARSIV